MCRKKKKKDTHVKAGLDDQISLTNMLAQIEFVCVKGCFCLVKSV